MSLKAYEIFKGTTYAERRNDQIAKKALKTDNFNERLHDKILNFNSKTNKKILHEAAESNQKIRLKDRKKSRKTSQENIDPN